MSESYVISDLKKATDADLLAEVHAELSPVYHFTPGGLKWSRSTDALREIAARLAQREEALTTLRDAWNAHFSTCPSPTLNVPQPTWEQLREWENAPNETANADRTQVIIDPALREAVLRIGELHEIEVAQRHHPITWWREMYGDDWVSASTTARRKLDEAIRAAVIEVKGANA